MIGINGRDGDDRNGVQTNQETDRMIVIYKTLVLTVRTGNEIGRKISL